MNNDAIKDALDKAIEKANELNDDATKVLSEAIAGALASHGGYDIDDYRFKCARGMLKAYLREHNAILPFMSRYAIARIKVAKAQAAKAKVSR